ncbi:DUF397 domain-containing protein [Streptomyces sp. DSM 44915]|uniref:DUF397 domain-containing protein n=1 Tax=Streptomyces chisholmiae TaxID=3075540 RepID=A0ABU2JVP3_9ACTN|nr:DUF397 domain-containing protein [Streptomyces sp. DSM 44915]MDT0269055.1 DUF397 domain-containing protein [Streptomyces sp. DSM 44915]
MIKNLDLTNAVWTKSHRSNGGANCLEVAFLDGVVALRDSKDVGHPDARVLVLSMDDYRAFVGGIQDGQADLLA